MVGECLPIHGSSREAGPLVRRSLRGSPWLLRMPQLLCSVDVLQNSIGHRSLQVRPV
jgi:hypothetical protein